MDQSATTVHESRWLCINKDGIVAHFPALPEGALEVLHLLKAGLVKPM